MIFARSQDLDTPFVPRIGLLSDVSGSLIVVVHGIKYSPTARRLLLTKTLILWYREA